MVYNLNKLRILEFEILLHKNVNYTYIQIEAVRQATLKTW